MRPFRVLGEGGFRGLGAAGGGGLAAQVAALNPAIWIESTQGLYQDASATTPALAGDAVALWRGVNAVDFAEVVASRRPVVALDVVTGDAVVRFAATSPSVMYTSAIPSLSNTVQTWFMVYRLTDLLATYTLLDNQYTVADRALIRHINVEHRIYNRDAADTPMIGGQHTANTEWVMVTLEWLADDTMIMRVNGNQAHAVVSGADGNATGHTNVLIGAANTSGSASPANAQVKALVGIPGEISPHSRNIVEQYLAQKFDINIAHLEQVSHKTLWNDVGEPDWYGRPRILDRGDGTWIAIYRISTEHGGVGTFNIRFSQDEGVTWTAINTFTDASAVVGFPIAGHAGANVSDAEIVIAPNGDLLVFASDTGIYQWRSTDGGKTWLDEGLINADTNLTAGGQIISMADTMYYALWSNPSTYNSELWTSDDNGAAWSKVSDITASGTNEDAVIVLANGDFYALLRDTANLVTYKSVSSNSGATWSAIAVEPQLYILQRPRLLRFSGSSRIYAIGRCFANQTAIFYSDDDCMTWCGPFYISFGFNDGAYCDMLKMTNGDLYVMTYEGVGTVASVASYIVRLGRS